jgi:nucleoside-diphosphate-sugar epimerase
MLAEAGARHGVKSFYNTSTSLPEGVNDYSRSKKQWDTWLQTFSDAFKVINIVPQYFYGPGDDSTKFITMLIGKMNADEPEIKLSSCEQKRDFFFIDDLVNAYTSIVDHEKGIKSSSSFAVGSGHAVSLREIVLQVAQVMGYETDKLKFGALPTRPNDIMFSEANINSIKKIGWKPEVPFAEGLRRTTGK